MPYDWMESPKFGWLPNFGDRAPKFGLIKSSIAVNPLIIDVFRLHHRKEE